MQLYTHEYCTLHTFIMKTKCFRLDQHVINESPSFALMVIETDETFLLLENINVNRVSSCLHNTYRLKLILMNWLGFVHTMYEFGIWYLCIGKWSIFCLAAWTDTHFEIRTSLKPHMKTFERWKHPIYNIHWTWEHRKMVYSIQCTQLCVVTLNSQDPIQLVNASHLSTNTSEFGILCNHVLECVVANVRRLKFEWQCQCTIDATQWNVDVVFVCFYAKKMFLVLSGSSVKFLVCNTYLTPHGW